MDSSLARRPLAKYGKNSRRVLVHDFFDKSMNSDGANTATRLPISPSSPGAQAVSLKDALQSPTTAKSVKPAHVTAHSSTPASINSPSSTSTEDETDQLAPTDASLYDLTSDEEMEVRTVKRRKLVQPKQIQPASGHALKTSLKQNPVKARTSSAKTAPQSTEVDSTIKIEPKPATKDSVLKTINLTQDTKNAHRTASQPRVRQQLNLAKNKIGKIDNGEEHRILLGADEDLQMFEQPVATPSPPYLSDHSNKSILSHGSTPKRKRRTPQLSDTAVSSPSQLGIRDLRLTPEKSPRQKEFGSGYNSPRRGRARMIDRLDAPAPDVGSGESSRTRSVEISDKTLEQANPQKQLGSIVAVQKLEETTLPRSESSSKTRQTYGRGRTTYAKERSHLADMVDSLEGWNADSGQEASQALAAQLVATSRPSQIQLEFELDDEPEDGTNTSGKLKSIHELRQAGANNRFDRELEGLMEDIDPNSPNSTKSLRIQCLTKLIRKLRLGSFMAVFLQSGLSRICRWSKLLSDKTSLILVGIILWQTANVEKTSVRSLRELFNSATNLSDMLLEPSTTFLDTIHNRKQNLSKATIRDLQAFHQSLTEDNLLPAICGPVVLPATIALGAINDSLRGLALLNDRDVQIPSTCHEHILQLLKWLAAQDGVTSNPEFRYVIKLALTFLELSTGPFDDDLRLSNNQYRTLGEVLARLMSNANSSDDLRQAVLRLVLSLSNNREQICCRLGESDLTDQIAGIIDTMFLNLAVQAETEHKVDESMLEAVILCTGCLLNLTEYAANVRQKLAKSSLYTQNNKTHLENFVSIFNSQAAKLTDATEAEQGQVLVAFGYLSMLLCTLCLDHDIRSRISRLLQKQKLDDIFDAAETFLRHFQTIQKQQAADAAMTVTTSEEEDLKLQRGLEASAAFEENGIAGFTIRFSQIISAARAGGM